MTEAELSKAVELVARYYRKGGLQAEKYLLRMELEELGVVIDPPKTVPVRKK